MADRSSVGATLSSPATPDAKGVPNDPASILAAALAQRKNKVSQSGNLAVRRWLTVDDEDEGEDW